MRDTKEIHIKAEIKSFFEETRGSSGSRSIESYLKNNTEHCAGRHKVRRMMRDMALKSTQPSSPKYRAAKQSHLSIGNHLDRQFAVVKPNQVWCGDTTFIWTGKRWSYLAVVIDLYARKIVGWAMSERHNAPLAKEALLMAYQLRGKPKGLLFHSDQGVQYTSTEFQQLLWRTRINPSMSRRGNCWDNAPMERVFRSLKSEWIPKYGYSNHNEAVKDVSYYLVTHYNERRPQSTNGGLSPNNKEKTFS